jgi:hypothetical protein
MRAKNVVRGCDLQAHERSLSGMLQLQERAAAAIQIEYINTLTATNADFLQKISNMYFHRPDQVTAAPC